MLTQTLKAFVKTNTHTYMLMLIRMIMKLNGRIIFAYMFVYVIRTPSGGHIEAHLQAHVIHARANLRIPYH